jgi:hypothetical protein
MRDAYVARPQPDWSYPRLIMACPDHDDDDDAEPDDDDEDERIARAYHPRWSSRAGFGSPQWWFGS